LLICSPQALRHSEAVNEKNHYNSLQYLAEMMAKWQTTCTPNVLGIYLLMRTLENRKPIEEVHNEVVDRYERWIAFLTSSATLKHLITNEDVRSNTVVPVTTSGDLAKIKKEAKASGLLLGEGYGEWKPASFRIANFPAIQDKEIQILMKFLRKF
jgi:phosphoserine aminotransferase